MTDSSEQINARVWRSSRVRDIFAERAGWIDEGEGLVMMRALREAAGQPILDIGVGAGRTIPLLRGQSDRYVAVDYLDEMVQLARSLHPGVRIEQADARNLSTFEDGSFAAVLFSFNGVDGLVHDDRRLVYRSVLRVLRPGGLFALSTHNLDYLAAGRAPWHRSQLDLNNGARAMLACAARLPKRSYSYRRLRPLSIRDDGWAVLVGSGYDFSVLWHHASLRHARRELAEAGFLADVEAFAPSGAPLDASHDTSDCAWIYLIARNPDASS